MGKSPFTRVVLPIVDKLSRFFSQMTPVTSLNRARVSIIQAGLQGKVTPTQITTLSYIMMIVIPFMSLSFTGLPTGILSKETAILFIGFILGYRLPFGYIQGKAKTRQHEIRKALPFTLDLISISVEAGMALDGAMQIVMEKSTGPMSEELNLTLREIRLGKGRNEALIDMGERLGVDELKSFVTRSYLHRAIGWIVGRRHPDSGPGHAYQTPSKGRGKGHEDARQDHDPVGLLYLPFHVHRHPRSGGHYHDRNDDSGEVMIYVADIITLGESASNVAR